MGDSKLAAFNLDDLDQKQVIDTSILLAIHPLRPFFNKHEIWR